MTDGAARKANWGFWIISVVALIWNAMGVMNFFVQMDPANLANYPVSHRALIETQPAWAKAGFALSVFGGTLGAVLLLLKKATASYAFVVSLFGTVLVMIHTLGSEIDFSAFDIGLTIVMPLLVAAFLVWYAALGKRKDWIG